MTNDEGEVNTTIAIAETDEEISGCFAVMSELRPQVARETFLPRVRQQMGGGYKLAYLSDGGEVAACAGFRVFDTLPWGRVLYVDDLITAERSRSRGFGARMMEWLLEYARREKCQELHLDSGTWRTAAHRFYFREGMVVKSFHFSRDVG